MKCKYCGKEIQFFKVPSGAKMPVETEKIFYKDKGKGRDRLATLEGRGVRIISCTFCPAAHEAVQGYGFLPHFANCRNYGKKEIREDGDQLRMF